MSSNRTPDRRRRKGAPVSLGARRYGLEPDIDIVDGGIERMREFLGHMQKLGADGSEHEVELARRGLLDEGALEIAWVEEHAVVLVES
jgi:hypothetical protein